VRIGSTYRQKPPLYSFRSNRAHPRIRATGRRRVPAAPITD